MIRFIHTADIHFGMENYGKVDPVSGIHSRLLDFKKSFDLCIDYAIDQRVDLFVFAGDAYKTAHPTPTQQKLLMQSLLRLHQAKIPTIIVVGNHDNPLSFGKANALDIFAHLPIDGFYVFSKPDHITIQTKSGPVQIVGIPWPNRHNLALNAAHHFDSATALTRHISESLGSIIAHLAQKLDSTIPAILTGHLTVSAGIFSGSEKRAIYGHDPIVLPSQLAIEPFDYVALGHLHRFQNINPEGTIPIVYAGSIDRIDFGERKETKGFCDVKILKKHQVEFTHITIPTRPFLQIEVTLHDNTDQTEQIVHALKQYRIDDAIVKILYEIPVHMTDQVDIKKIQKECSNAMFVVGIIPVRCAQTRTHRNIVSESMNFETLLQTYLQTQPHLQKRADILLQKINQLQNLQETYQENNTD